MRGEAMKSYPSLDQLINAHSNGGMTPLMKAAESCSNSAVYYLLESGANPLLVDNRGKSAINYARAFYPQHEIVDRLKEASEIFATDQPNQ